MPPSLAALFAVLCAVPIGAARAQSLIDFGLHDLSDAGLAAFAAYRLAPAPKAFAVGAEGAWGWVAAVDDLDAARAMALDRCAGHSDIGCRVVAVQAPGLPDISDLPPPGQRAYEAFLRADGSKAFAVSPDGAWAWVAAAGITGEVARARALETCAERADGCAVIGVGYGVDGISAAGDDDRPPMTGLGGAD